MAPDKDIAKHNLPRRPSCIGREGEIDRVLNWLVPGQTSQPAKDRQKKNTPVPALEGVFLVEIIGTPGIGKTTLTCEMGYRCAESGAFQSVVWADAPRLKVIMESRPENEIRRMIQGHAISDPSIESGEHRVQEQVDPNLDEALDLIKQKPCLLIVDGWDEFGEDVSVDDILRYVEMMSADDKVLVTSRTGLPEKRTGQATIRLGPLSCTDAKKLIRDSYDIAGITTHLAESDVDELYDLTQGHPRAIAEGTFSRFAGGPMVTASVMSERLSLENIHGPMPFYHPDAIKALTEEQKYILVMAAISSVPISQTEIALTCGIVDRKEASECINKLVRQCYLEEEIDDKSRHNRYFVFPFLRDYFLEHLNTHKETLPEFAAEHWWQYLKEHPDAFQIVDEHLGKVRDAFNWYYDQQSWGVVTEFGEILSDLLVQLGALERQSSREILDEVCTKALDACERVENWQNWVYFANNLGWVRFHRGYLNEAKEWTQRAKQKLEEEAESLVDPQFIPVLRLLGAINLVREDFEEARHIFAEIRRQAREIGDDSQELRAEIDLGKLDMAQGNYANAEQRFRKVGSQAEAAGDKKTVATALLELGNLATRQCNRDEALRRYKQGLSEAKEAGERHVELRLRRQIRREEMDLENLARLEQSLQLLRESLRNLVRNEDSADEVLNQLETSLQDLGVAITTLNEVKDATLDSRVCPVCRRLIDIQDYPADHVIVCPQCKTHVHTDCWEYSGGCPNCGQKASPKPRRLS